MKKDNLANNENLKETDNEIEEVEGQAEQLKSDSKENSKKDKKIKKDKINKEKKKINKRELATKIMAAVMALLMLLAVSGTLIFYL